MKPLIGIMERPEMTRGKNSVTVMYDDVRSVIIKMGGVPIGIAPTTPISYVDKGYLDVRNMTKLEFLDMTSIIDLCGGVIFPGGDNVLDYDLKALEYCYQNKIPTLAICLGMQEMGTLFDGDVELLGNTNIKHREKKTIYAHPVRIDKTSKLYEIVKKEVIQVNSFHKSYVVHPKLDVVALAPDGTIEAIEDKKHPFFIGVQWHPESIYTYDMVSQKLFFNFFEHVKKRVEYVCRRTYPNCGWDFDTRKNSQEETKRSQN